MPRHDTEVTDSGEVSKPFISLADYQSKYDHIMVTAGKVVAMWLLDYWCTWCII